MPEKELRIGASLDYLFDWAPVRNGRVPPGSYDDWLAPSETIDSYTISADPGITIDSDELTDANSAVRVWISGGTVGQRYNLKCEVSTNWSPTRTDSRFMVLRCIK